ncbi:hypothetical protein AB0L06_13720 [Spirillospora sp. NPDC052269]
MDNTILVTATSLAGVVLGGGLSMITQRSVERAASRRHVASISEGRRSEQLARLIDFIQTAQEAERLAISMHQRGVDDDTTTERAESTLDQLWIRLRAVQLICSVEVSDAARSLAGEVHTVVRQGPGQQSVTSFLRPSRMNLIDLARIDFERI